MRPEIPKEAYEEALQFLEKAEAEIDQLAEELGAEASVCLIPFVLGIVL